MGDSGRFDVAVVGLGAMGSQTALTLARRGRRVVGFDAHRPPHSLGSTHGRTRIIREAYFEHPAYVPLVQRAYHLWEELERRSGERLLTITGGLMLGAPEAAVVTGARTSALEHGLAFEELSAREVRGRFPAFRVPSDHVGIFEPRAGFIDVERAVAATLALAEEDGAVLRYDERVLGWDADGDGVRLETPCGRYVADAVVFAAGAWLPKLMPELARLLTVTRQPLLWVEPRVPELFLPGRFPIFMWDFGEAAPLYGFPDTGAGVKVARHHGGEVVTADAVERALRTEDEAQVRGPLRALVPDADGPLRESAVCLYTNTPDHHFVLDRLPGEERVVVASPCSGHGFKFAPVIGEILADLVEGAASRADLSLFELSRFAEVA